MIRSWLTGAGLVAIALIAAGPSPRAADPAPDDEQQIGQELFNELKAKGEIVAASPLYDVLTPVTAPIVKTAQLRTTIPSGSISCTSRSRMRSRYRAATST